MKSIMKLCSLLYVVLKSVLSECTINKPYRVSRKTAQP